MAKEIERKYLIENNGWRDLNIKGKFYRQGYIPTAKGATIRVRIIKEKKAYLTIKGPTHGLTRSEYEYKIPVSDARQILHELCPHVLEKTRYKVHEGSLVWEIDVYHGANEGLITVEVELDSENQPVNPPSWVGREVTNESKYTSSSLARMPYNSWNIDERLR